MNKEEILEAVNKVLEDRGMDIAVESSDEFNSVGLDSIRIIEIIVAIEEKFNVEIPDEFLTLESIGSVDKLVKILGNI